MLNQTNYHCYIFKLKQLYKRLPVVFLNRYPANNMHTVQVVHQDGGLFLVYGIAIT